MKIRFFFYLLFAVFTGIAGCSNRPDPKKDFQIGLDGENYLWQPGPTNAYIEGYGIYETTANRTIMVVFPPQMSGPVTTKGLNIRLSSALVQPG
ncbi:MAG: hypothetical protein QME74_05895, partial [Candidatus Edwardsbacteria bacterium]|nr:hypothetical protein [Candidatus Edwardsbacteria bacterium]